MAVSLLMRKFAGVVAVALALGVAPAAADRASFHDADEQPFCEAPGPCPDSDYMDFRRLTQGHGNSPDRVRHGVHTYKRWRTRGLGGRHGTTIAVEFDTDRTGRPERQVRIRRKEGRLWAAMFTGRYFRGEVPGRARVWRPNRRSVKVQFSLDMLGEAVTEYRWRALWWDRNLACPGSCHTDDAPERGWFAHLL